MPIPSDRWHMPAEERAHERTWMCWPSRVEVWGRDLAHVQDTIAVVALTISEFEPVTMLARPDALRGARAALGKDVELVEAPVDDLWARDTLPNFLVRGHAGATELAAGHARFTGWGGKQIHGGDAQLARVVAEYLQIPLMESGLVGEGGAIEVDGEGTVLAAASCWVNANRNPGKSRAEIEHDVLAMLGADRMIWVDGLAGHDITDGHIDTLARFASETVIVVDKPAINDPSDPWVAVADRTKQQVAEARTAAGEPYELVEIVQPERTRRSGDDFLATYMNYYLCNAGVVAPQFGDKAADAAAREVLQDLFPEHEIVMVDIDSLAAGGGGIHCATQQQPKVT